MKISENTSVSMPMKNLISIVISVAIGVWAYFGIVEKLNKHSTTLELMQADLLKKAQQEPKNLEMYMLIEHNAGIIEKHQEQLDENVHTKVLLMEANKKIEKLQQDVEKLIRKKMEITNGRNNSIVNVCRFRTKTYRNDLHAFSETLFGEA